MGREKQDDSFRPCINRRIFFELLVVPEEVKPKYINGAKCYGRRTQPELQGTKLDPSKYLQEQQAKANIKSQLRRSASLESVEVSLTHPPTTHQLAKFY